MSERTTRMKIDQLLDGNPQKLTSELREELANLHTNSLLSEYGYQNQAFLLQRTYDSRSLFLLAQKEGLAELAEEIAEQIKERIKQIEKEEFLFTLRNGVKL